MFWNGGEPDLLEILLKFKRLLVHRGNWKGINWSTHFYPSCPMLNSSTVTPANASKSLEKSYTVAIAQDFPLNPNLDKSGITARERAVIECLCADMTVKIIASHLCISEYTIQDHIKNIKRKLGVHTANGLVARALQPYP